MTGDCCSTDAWVTAQEVLLGFALALVAGVAIALRCTSPGSCGAPCYPLVVASQAVPVVVIAPILVIWFGFGMTPKLIVIALICFFPIVVNTLDGLRAVDPAQVEDAAHAGRRTAGRCCAAWSSPPRSHTSSRARRWPSRSRSSEPCSASWSAPTQGSATRSRWAWLSSLTARVFAAVVILSAMAIGLFALVSRRGAARRPVGRAPEGAGVSRAAQPSAAVVLAVAMLWRPPAARSRRTSAAPRPAPSST